MWFRDDNFVGGRPFGRRGTRDYTPVLQVNARLAANKPGGDIRWGVFFVIPVAALVLCWLLWLGVRTAGEKLFTRNDGYAIRTLEIKGGGVILRDFVRGKMRINEGTNLFAFDINQIRREFLRGAPNFKSMVVTRRLPDTLIVEVVRRTPMARLGTGGVLVTDAEGWMFRWTAGTQRLPVIEGYDAVKMKPGGRLDGPSMAALQVLEVCDHPNLGLDVRMVNVRTPEKPVLYIVHGGEVRQFVVDWKGMGKRTRESQDNLLRKLSDIAETLKSARSHPLTRFDATFDDRIIGW
jgi:hypothetical protein